MGDAIKKFFEQYAEVANKVLDFIEPHMPKIMEIAGFLGRFAFQPLISLLTGLTKVLSWVSGSGGEEETTTTTTNSSGSGTNFNTNNGEGSNTYPLRGTNFLGDFVEPGFKYDKVIGEFGDGIDTSMIDRTLADLVKEYGESAELGRYGIRLSSALAAVKNMGKDPETFKFNPSGQDLIFKELKNMAGFQDFLGEKIDVNQFAANLSRFFDEIPASESAVTNNTKTWKETLSVLESLKGGMSKGGLIRGPQSGYPVGFNPVISRSIGGFVGHGTEMIVPIDTPDTRKDSGLSMRRLLEAALIIGSKGDTGTMLASLTDTVNDGEAALESAAMNSNIETIVLDVIERPVQTKECGEGQEIVIPTKEDEVNGYIQSRFGFMTENNTSPSNFF